MVKDHLILMASMSDRKQALLETPHVRGRLTVADSIALHHRQELSKASSFVSTVDPWCYSADEDGNEEPSQWNVKRYVQKVVDQSAHAAKNLSDFTDASVSAFLLSPLLVRTGQRPLLIRKTAAERRTPLCASAAVKALGGAAALSVPVSGAVFRPAPGTAKRPTPFLSTVG
jgi:hypothetical protein